MHPSRWALFPALLQALTNSTVVFRHSIPCSQPPTHEWPCSVLAASSLHPRCNLPPALALMGPLLQNLMCEYAMLKGREDCEANINWKIREALVDKLYQDGVTGLVLVVSAHEVWRDAKENMSRLSRKTTLAIPEQSTRRTHEILEVRKASSLLTSAPPHLLTCLPPHCARGALPSWPYAVRDTRRSCMCQDCPT